MKCVVLHQDVPPDAPPDEQDVLAQAASVAAVLRRFGWAAVARAVTLDLGTLARELAREPPDLVFNLVETLAGFGALAAAVPALLESLRVPFTGNGAAAVALAADKQATRRALRLAGIPVPPGPEDGWPGPFIVKRATEHASIGLGPHSVVAQLPSLEHGFYAEAFIDGPEYNVSMLADPDGCCTVLPIPELVYAAEWPAGMPRIFDYAGKWDPVHPHFLLTSSRFSNAAELAPLARAVWDALGLAGYARIDLRLGTGSVAYVIDVNANSCLNEGICLAAAAAQAGIDYATLIGRIIEDALTRGQRKDTSSPAQRQGPAALLDARCRDGRDGSFRRHLIPADQAAIVSLCRGSGFFTDAEVAIAGELVADRLVRGETSDYRFLLVEDANGRVIGYACYGAIAGTNGAWDLYWIVVDRTARGRGIGRRLLEQVLVEAAAAGATGLYAETEASQLYAPTRAFYAGCGFHLQAVLPNFYRPGIAKQIWVRPVRPGL